ncbi:uncharacterized protein LACBIDRAFT_236174 [Laccaria bicolor S238N-H82]|uniref:Predicted protein n=1 Tax=Laccaria bicolor (strain S238N-H82 / ATCC MYA-4686) TaxID=486041 RepID=B0DFJ2_LACBS|nr:uncharacterized protein LACBIDRAFT_236174 [Laccaria bicolor S238N-H82]EDR06873.1 predicted protein [Laccaria bicolor S238N-H82]|eukprot:XP_001882720.1 predicted protein [Laccaria bicolor S238N-H82]
MHSLEVIATGLAVAIALWGLLKKKSISLPTPPGPKKLPILGNLLDIPTTFEWITYARWSKEYDSDILHIQAVGVDIIILNSFKAANELLDKRSAIYSSRTRFTMISELMGWGWLMSAMPYGESWRERRRLFQSYFHPGKPTTHQPRQLEYIRGMLLPQLLADPENYADSLKHTIGGMALSLAYGIKVLPREDPHIRIAEEALGTFTQVTVSGRVLVDLIPPLKHIPEWMPGAGFKRQAKIWHALQKKFRERPFDDCLKEIAAGTVQSCFTSACIENVDGNSVDAEHQLEVIQDTSAMVFGGGADTTLSAVETFILAMINFSDIQLKAQEEVDRVVERSRLPNFADEADMPYLSAVVKEVFRFVCIPHLASEDDVYEGYHIPKNSIIIANSWAMLHDDNEYVEPEKFNPNRFLDKDGQLDPNVLDPARMVFGFGRRICPGSHIAQSTLWLVAASMLATFDITKGLDESGKEVEPGLEYTSGLIM